MSCPICLDELDDLQLYETECLHIFHKTCFDKGSFKNCPMCRTKIIHNYDYYYKIYCNNRDELLDNNMIFDTWIKHKINTIKLLYDHKDTMPLRISLVYITYDTFINLIEYKEFLLYETKRDIFNKKFITFIYNKIFELHHRVNIDMSKYENIIKNHLDTL